MPRAARAIPGIPNEPLRDGYFLAAGFLGFLIRV